MHDGKHRVLVFFDLWALVPVAGVFDREFVQAEFLLHLFEFRPGGVAQGDPDETVAALEVVADLVDRQIGDARSVLVGDAIYEHFDSFFLVAASDDSSAP